MSDPYRTNALVPEPEYDRIEHKMWWCREYHFLFGCIRNCWVDFPTRHATPWIIVELRPREYDRIHGSIVELRPR